MIFFYFEERSNYSFDIVCIIYIRDFYIYLLFFPFFFAFCWDNWKVSWNCKVDGEIIPIKWKKFWFKITNVIVCLFRPSQTSLKSECFHRSLKVFASRIAQKPISKSIRLNLWLMMIFFCLISLYENKSETTKKTIKIKNDVTFCA